MTGTTTSSPIESTSSQYELNIPNVMMWMQHNAYQESTIRKVAKWLRHLKKNCSTADPEAVKFYVSKKNCSNGHEENLIETYDLFMRKPFR